MKRARSSSSSGGGTAAKKRKVGDVVPVNSTCTCYYDTESPFYRADASVYIMRGKWGEFPAVTGTVRTPLGEQISVMTFNDASKCIVTGMDNPASAVSTILFYGALCTLATGDAPVLTAMHMNNCVCTGSLPGFVLLSKMSASIPWAKYAMDVFPGLTLDIRGANAPELSGITSNIKITVFRGGKYNITGASESKDLEAATKYFIKIVQPFLSDTMEPRESMGLI